MTDLAAQFELRVERMDSPSSRSERIRALYEEHVEYVWTALRRLGVAPSDSEDLTHEVFLRVLRDWDRFDQSRAVRPWLFGIAHHVAVDFFRRQQHPAAASEQLSGDLVSERPAPDSEVARAQERQVLESILLSMDIDLRAVLVMHELFGHTAPEIAAALAIPMNTVYSRLRLARGDFDSRVRRRRVQP